MKQRIAALLVLGLSPWAGLYAQQSATATFRVAAKVEDSCDVSAIGRSLLRATCTPDATYQFVLRKGTPRSAMSNRPTGRDAEFGVGTGEAVDHTLFGGIPATRVVPAGDYADTVTVQVFY